MFFLQRGITSSSSKMRFKRAHCGQGWDERQPVAGEGLTVNHLNCRATGHGKCRTLLRPEGPLDFFSWRIAAVRRGIEFDAAGSGSVWRVQPRGTNKGSRNFSARR